MNKKNIFSNFLTLLLLSPGLKLITTYIVKLMITRRKKLAIAQAKRKSKKYNTTYYVMQYHNGTRFVAMSTMSESLMRKQKKTKRMKFKTLQKGCVYIATA